MYVVVYRKWQDLGITLSKGGIYMYTLSLHNGGQHVVRQDHNARRYVPDNADASCTGDNIVLRDVDVRRAYHRIFDTAQSDYNARMVANGRANRQIDDYYTKIATDPHKHTVYELVVQLGGVQDGGAPTRAVDALRAYVDGWVKANPRLAMCGAYIHMDEATPHLHLDYIPVADGCTRGMSRQNSLTGALRAQGFVSNGTRDTAQMQWEQSERDRMRDICQYMGIALHQQGIGRKRHLTVDEYKQAQDQLRTTREQAKQASQDMVKAQAEADSLQRNITAYKANIDRAQGQLEGIGRQCIDRQADLDRLNQQIADIMYEWDNGYYWGHLQDAWTLLKEQYPDHAAWCWDQTAPDVPELEAEADDLTR